MKTILINGSPRKNWNTHKLLLETERGAKEMGAETELLHLFDLSFTDCKSCFACKLRGNKTGGTCVLRDDLKPVLEKIGGADVVVIGSPVYYGHLTSPVLSLITRTTFPLMHYELDPATGSPAKEQHYNKQCGLIVTMNADENYLRSGYYKTLKLPQGRFAWGLGIVRHSIPAIPVSSRIIRNTMPPCGTRDIKSSIGTDNSRLIFRTLMNWANVCAERRLNNDHGRKPL